MYGSKIKKEECSDLSSGTSTALSTSASGIPLLLCDGATLQVDVQHGLVDELRRAVRASHRLLVCNGTSSGFKCAPASDQLILL